MPLWYEGIKAEHLTVRANVGLLDLSHMGEIFISGPQAFDLIQYLTCNDLRRIGDGQCQYTLFPTEEGGVVDDLIVYQYNPEKYMLVVNASNVAKDHAWILKHAPKFDCKVDNKSEAYSLVAVAGPRTDALLEAAGFKDIAEQKAFTFRTVKIDGKSIIVAGTGYTGERGFELIIENEHAGWLWDRLFALAPQFGGKPVGLGARDTLRLEMAYSLYGSELSDTISVLEANLGWAVRFGPDFIGKAYLEKQKAEGVKRIICGLVCADKGATPRHDAKVCDSAGTQIGYVTSGSFSPSLEKGIALALVATEHTTVGNELQVEVRGKLAPATVVDLPFYKKPKG
jgi:aminomethyltransferase